MPYIHSTPFPAQPSPIHNLFQLREAAQRSDEAASKKFEENYECPMACSLQRYQYPFSLLTKIHNYVNNKPPQQSCQQAICAWHSRSSHKTESSFVGSLS